MKGLAFQMWELEPTDGCQLSAFSRSPLSRKSRFAKVVPSQHSLPLLAVSWYNSVWHGKHRYSYRRYSPEIPIGLAKVFVGPTWQFNFFSYPVQLPASFSSWSLFDCKRLSLIEQFLIYRKLEKISQLAYSVSPNTLLYSPNTLL